MAPGRTDSLVHIGGSPTHAVGPCTHMAERDGQKAGDADEMLIDVVEMLMEMSRSCRSSGKQQAQKESCLPMVGAALRYRCMCR